MIHLTRLFANTCLHDSALCMTLVCGSNVFILLSCLSAACFCLSVGVWVQWVTRALLCRCGERSTVETFLGSDLVRWLMSVGLASDSGEAVAYGSRLLEGGVIQHITSEHEFQDEALHYRFT